MRKHKNKIIAGVIILLVLAFVFWYGGDATGLRGWTSQPKETVVTVQNSKLTKKETNEVPKVISDISAKEENEPATKEYGAVNQSDEPSKEEINAAEKAISDIPIKKENEPAIEENKPQKQDGTLMTPAEKIAMAEKIAENTQSPVEEQATTHKISSDEIMQSNEEYSEEQGMLINEVTGKDKYRTEPVPEGKPIPIEPENVVITDKELTCTLSVRCDTILNNIGWLDSEKIDIVPIDGVIFAEKTVVFYEGDSVFNLLLREMKRNKIHMEFENTPIYNSAYIEGIANLYEFDCGELSGWMYKVNDWFPNYGCSRYQLKAGDKVEWVYTCDLGNDVGGNYSARNGN